MKSKKHKKELKTYCLIGKSLCACAGGIIGFVLAGPLLAILGLMIGILGGHLLEKGVINYAN